MTCMIILALFSIDRAIVSFSIANRGVWNDTIEDISFFYGYITLTWAALGWYFISGLTVWVTVQSFKDLRGGWRKWITITSLIALFIAPGVFVDPDRVPNVMYLLSAADFNTPSPVLPAWVSILGYLIEAPYSWYRLFAISVTFWPIPLTLSVLLGLSLCTKVSRDFLWG